MIWADKNHLPPISLTVSNLTPKFIVTTPLDHILSMWSSSLLPYVSLLIGRYKNNGLVSRVGITFFLIYRQMNVLNVGLFLHYMFNQTPDFTRKCNIEGRPSYH